MTEHSHTTPETQVYSTDLRRHLAEDHGDLHALEKDTYRHMRSCLAAHLHYHPDHRVVHMRGDMELKGT